MKYVKLSLHHPNNNSWRGKRLLLGVLIVLFLFSAGCATKSEDSRHDPLSHGPEDDWVLNVEGAPLVLRGFEYGYRVSNTSKDEIVSFALGCVQLGNGQNRILHTFASHEGRLRPGEEITAGRIDGIPDEKVECVEKRKAKLTVLNTKFADNQSWTFPDH